MMFSIKGNHGRHSWWSFTSWFFFYSFVLLVYLVSMLPGDGVKKNCHALPGPPNGNIELNYQVSGDSWSRLFVRSGTWHGFTELTRFYMSDLDDSSYLPFSSLLISFSLHS